MGGLTTEKKKHLSNPAVVSLFLFCHHKGFSLFDIRSFKFYLLLVFPANV